MRILVVEDDRALRGELSRFLGAQGHECAQAETLAEARAALAREPAPDLALVDLYLGAELGSELLREPRGVPIVMISGAGTIRDSVAALKAGAWDFLEKPVDPDRLLGIVRNLDRSVRAERGIAALRDAWLAEHAVSAPGSPFAAALEEARRVAPSPLSVLVTGPTGSGKEVVARWIHYCSGRSGGPFVAVNCAAVPLELAESSFFGSRRGAFTGAAEDRQGWFQAADGGTLFLDEVGDIPGAIQAKLLRAVEEGEVQRVGSTATERVSVRLVCATNRDLQAEASAGSFRRDLFFRLAQSVIRVPSLAERRADIGPLASFLLTRSAGGDFADRGAVADRPVIRFEADALAWLEDRSWPGNVRELKSFVERARWLCAGPRIGAADLAALDGGGGRGRLPVSPLPEAGAATNGSAGGAAAPAANATTDDWRRGHFASRPLREARLDFEREYIRAALAASEGSIAGAADFLGLLPNNLSRRMRELGISARRNGEERRSED